ncbi:ankyrin [Mytilinidion resinicola]|uniref:Ankyrin n=1 Tax=Mytilinidion resinicola TaxID=574789 RepID=A0A6A6ZCS7_9PEZI|nr:ankyrin [Mytilinidion resinicola]KAF2818007.1 ankyrin [Mytilinidion resinicola]
MDGISAAASVVAVFQLSKLLMQSCIEYCEDFKNAKDDLRRLRQAVTELRDALEDLKDIYDTADTVELSALARLMEKDGIFAQCKTAMEAIMKELDGFTVSSKASSEQLRKCLKWPFNKKKMDEKIEALQKHRNAIQLALASDQLSVTLSTEAHVLAMRADTVTQQAMEFREKILRWLPGADTSSNYQAAQEQHHKGTCSWLFGTPEYREWKSSPRTFLWLYGIPGCGKTVMSSTVIPDLNGKYEPQNIPIVTYFYFSFGSKRDGTNFLASLIQQLLSQSRDYQFPEELRQLYRRKQDGNAAPSSKDLVPILKIILESFSRIGLDVFVIIDGLDECPKGDTRNAVLGHLNSVAAFDCNCLHLLVASRPEHDIKKALEPLLTFKPLSIDEIHVRSDVALYVQHEISDDPKLRKWEGKLAREIVLTLVEKSNGMFRWVYCQLVELRKCKSPAKLKKALQTLPQTLDETYTRILDNMDEDDREITQRALAWLAFKLDSHNLTLEVLAEAAVVETSQDVPFDLDNRLQDPEGDICEILGSLIVLDQSAEKKTVIRLAHFIVKEYLLSERSVKYGITEQCAHACIARAGISYLRSLCRLIKTPGDWMNHSSSFPLLPYLTNYLMGDNRHIVRGHQESCPGLTSLFMDLLHSPEVYKTLFYPSDTNYIVHSASSWGYTEVVRALLEDGQNPTRATPNNGQTALHCAASFAKEDVVKILLEYDVQIDARNADRYTPLCSGNGLIDIVQLLIQKGLNVNEKSPKRKTTPLFWAITRHQKETVKLLPDHGAETDCETLLGETLFMAACSQVDVEIIAMLLEHGASPKRLMEDGSTVLHSLRNNMGTALTVYTHFHLGSLKSTIRLLIKHGVDVQAKNDKGQTALDLFRRWDDKAVVEDVERILIQGSTEEGLVIEE